MKHTLQKLTVIKYCTGCTACASVCPKKCITMKADADGSSYPVVDEGACVGCGLCEKACPVLTGVQYEHTPTAYAARSLDTAMRLESSSGGVFTELARQILAQGGAVFGAAYDVDFRVIHICAEDEAQLTRLRGAKYAQSDLNGIFPEIKDRLVKGQQVLFSGTPCQVAGLLGFLGRSYNNLITVDFVCHSVPSPMAWAEYVKSLGNVASVNLRAKDTGWSRYRYCHRIADPSGAVRTIPNGESLYMKLFVGGYINRESCANCQFKGYHRASDLTIGDFWGIWDVDPEMDDNKGTSVVLVQSDRGAELLQKLADRLVIRSVSLEEASRQNQAMLKVSAPATQRQDALALIKEGRIAECEKWFVEKKPSLGVRAKNKLKCLIRKIIH